MELTERLRAALDAEEARLRVLPPFPWKLNPDESEEVLAADNIMVASVFALSSNQGRRTAEHIALHDPERELRMVAAHRKILDLHEPTIKTRDMYDSRGLRTGEQRTDYHCGTCGGRDWDLDPIGDKPCRTLLVLAEAYGVEA